MQGLCQPNRAPLHRARPQLRVWDPGRASGLDHLYSHESTKGLVDTHVEIFIHDYNRFSGLAVSYPTLLIGLWTNINSNQVAHELGLPTW